MIAAPRRIVVCAVGLKGAVFVEGLLARGQHIDALFSYEQPDDGSQSFGELGRLASRTGMAFHAQRRPVLEAGDLVFLAGWQFLVPDVPGAALIVFHDSLLPRYRGFSPTVSALIAGDRTIGVTAFSPRAGVDEGPVAAQRSVVVDYPLKIADALAMQARLMIDIAVDLTVRHANGTLRFEEQDHAQATYSLWRDDADYEIDWRESAARLARFVDAVGHPYAGARTTFRGEVVIIDEATALPDLPFVNRAPGKIWRIDDNRAVVVCGEGLLRLEHCRDRHGGTLDAWNLRARFGAG